MERYASTFTLSLNLVKMSLHATDILHILWLCPSQVLSKMDLCPLFASLLILVGGTREGTIVLYYHLLPRGSGEIIFLISFFIVVLNFSVLFQFFTFLFVVFLDFHNSLHPSFSLSLLDNIMLPRNDFLL